MLVAASFAIDHQSFQGQTIKKIILVGNKKTQDEVILRELRSREGEPYDSVAILHDQRRLQNLQLFTRVRVEPVTAQAGLVLVIRVAERWYFFPYPVLFRNERDWRKWSYGLGLIHENFRGRNIEVRGYAWAGYNPGFNFVYENPWFAGDARLFTSLEFFSADIKSKSTTAPRFDEHHTGFTAALGKRWSHTTYLMGQIGYDQIRFPKTYRNLVSVDEATWHLPSVGLAFGYDTRDLYEYARQGVRINAYVTENYYPDAFDYQLFGVDFRWYQPIIGKTSLALRLATDLSAGKLPIFTRKFLGYEERIRGQYFRHVEGDNRFIGAVEWRIPIFPVRYYDLSESAIIMKDYFKELPFGLSSGIFYDFAAVWDDHPQSAITVPGFGAGFHFLLPYSVVFRVEYGFDPRLNGQWIFDVEAAL